MQIFHIYFIKLDFIFFMASQQDKLKEMSTMCVEFEEL